MKNNYANFVSLRVIIVSLFLLASGFAEAQTYTAQCRNKCSNIQATEDCGGGVYKIKWWQGNQHWKGEIWIKENGTSIGANSSAWDYETNVSRVGDSDYPMRVAGQHSGRWVYVKINSNSAGLLDDKRIDMYFDDFTCVAASAPTVSTSAATAVNCNSATLEGDVTDEGTASLTARGFIIGTVEADVNSSELGSMVGSSTPEDEGGTVDGAYTKAISSLSSGTTYYVKAYATNSVGTGYGSAVSFDASFTVATSSGGSRNYADGAGPVNLTATTSTGSGNIKWYTTLAGGTAEATVASGANWATPDISAITIFYAEADDGSCTSSPRTAVTAEVKGTPGGISSNLHAWWKADAGTSTTTDDAIVSTWTDQSDNAWTANKEGNGADYWENGINFNPMLRFPGHANHRFKVTNGIYEGGTKADMFSYIVYNRHTSNEAHLLIGQSQGTGNLFGFGLHSNGSAFYYEGKNDDNGRTYGAWGGSVNQTYLWSAGSAQNGSTPQDGYTKYITRDNNIVSRTNGVDQRSGGTNHFYIGYWGGWVTDGDMAEIIVYDGTPTATEEDKIQSYLSVKYGITLASMNYLSSDGTTIWDNTANSAYHYDIAGIGHDAGSGLFQKQSKSVNSDAIVTMSSEAIAVNNAANGTLLDNGEFLLWGNDNASLSDIKRDELPTGYFARINREWVVDMTGTVENVHVEIDISDFGFLIGDEASDYYLLVDDNDNFTSGATGIAGSTLSGDKVTFNDVNFSDGDHFTLATKQPSPGGNYEKVLLWLRADAGTNTTTDGQRVTSWKSQAIGGTATPFTAVEMSSDGPTYVADGINGYPALDFSDNRMKITGGIMKNKNTGNAENKYNLFAYIVAQSHSLGQKTIFQQDNSGHHFIFRHWNSTNRSIDFYSGHGNSNQTHGFIKLDGEPVMNQTHIWTLGSTNLDASSTPYGYKRYIYRDGNELYGNTGSSTSRYVGGTSNFYIGNNNSTRYYDGLIAEIIVLDEAPTVAENQKILSYLNNKYGLTTASTDNFINSDGTSTWTYNSNYNTMIAGIRRDDITAANRKQSKANNTNAKMTISTQAISATNAANTTQIATDKSALVWAQKNGITRAVSTDASGLAGTFTQRLSSEWLVKETGTVGNVLVEVDLGGLTFDNESADKFGLVVDDDGDFTGGEQTLFIGDNLSGDKVTFNSVSLTGTKYMAVMNGAVATLPVEILYFEGKHIGSYVMLEWETMAEVNNDYFIVEKSTDGENWEELLTVAGQGNTSEQTYYSQIDINGCEGVCYYKLIQVDFDGKSEEVKIITLNSTNENAELSISVSPNPISQMAHIAFSAPEGGMFSLTVTTQTGQVLYTAKTMGDKGNNHISYDASSLSSGSYYFILEDENGKRTQQLVIK